MDWYRRRWKWQCLLNGSPNNGLVMMVMIMAEEIGGRFDFGGNVDGIGNVYVKWK